MFYLNLIVHPSCEAVAEAVAGIDIGEGIGEGIGLTHSQL
jgi:hypothetical protein